MSTRDAIERALRTVPFYAKQNLAERLTPDEPLAATLAKLPLLTRDRLRATLPKQWFPEGRDAKTELASGAISVIEVGGAARIRALFEPTWWREQERRALAMNHAAEGHWREAVLWTPERGTGSCGAGDPGYEERLEGGRLHLNSRQDPTFWTEPVMTRMLDELTLHETTAFLADPFYLDVLARHAAILGRRLDVRGFIATMRARPTEAHRAALARVFMGTTIDVLGAREVGTIFVQGADGKMHHAPFATHLELLKAKVPTPGAENVALVVVTSISREVQPLIRYVLGDLVQVHEGSTVNTIEGTFDDSIVRPDGALITPGAIDRAIGDGPRAYQVVQIDPNMVEIEVIGANPANIQERLSPLMTGVKVTSRTVTAIGVEPTGKYRTTRRNFPVAIEQVFHTEGTAS